MNEIDDVNRKQYTELGLYTEATLYPGQDPGTELSRATIFKSYSRGFVTLKTHEEDKPQASATVRVTGVLPGGNRVPPVAGNPTGGLYDIERGSLASLAVYSPLCSFNPKKMLG